MTIETLAHQEVDLESEMVTALAEASVASRESQQAEVERVRSSAARVIESDLALRDHFHKTIAAVTMRHGTVDARWPHRHAFDAMVDAVLAATVGDRIPRIEWEVLAWPWMSVFGPMDPSPVATEA